MDESIVSKAERFQELDSLILPALIEGMQTEDYSKPYQLISEFIQLKRELNVFFLDKPIFKLPHDANESVIKTLQAFKLGEKSSTEKALAGTLFEPLLNDEMEIQDFIELEDHFNSKYGYATYLMNMLDAASLVSDVDDLPSELISFLSEARECYGLGQYVAVKMLCRSALEAALRDLCVREGYFEVGTAQYKTRLSYIARKAKEQRRNLRVVEDYDPRPADYEYLLFQVPEFHRYRQGFRDLYHELSRVVHGNPNAIGPLVALRDTIKLLHNLYKV